MVKRDDYIAMIKIGRDDKVREHLMQYAPIWLVSERPEPDIDTLYFDVVFLHPYYRWVKRHYAYDYFTDVLHHRGQIQLTEDDILEITAGEPYMEASGSNSIMSYGG